LLSGACRRLSSSVTPAHMQRNSPGGSTRQRASSVTSRYGDTLFYSHRRQLRGVGFSPAFVCLPVCLSVCFSARYLKNRCSCESTVQPTVFCLNVPSLFQLFHQVQTSLQSYTATSPPVLPPGESINQFICPEMQDTGPDTHG